MNIETATMKVALNVNNEIEDFIVQSVIQEIGDKNIEVNAKKIAEAIEKQIPKKPASMKRGSMCWICVNCGNMVYSYYGLDWIF